MLIFPVDFFFLVGGGHVPVQLKLTTPWRFQGALRWPQARGAATMNPWCFLGKNLASEQFLDSISEREQDGRFRLAF